MKSEIVAYKCYCFLPMRFSNKQDGGCARERLKSLCAAKDGHGMGLAAIREYNLARILLYFREPIEAASIPR